MARFAEPSDQPDHRQAAVVRIRQAMAAAPLMVAGTGRFCTRVLAVAGERICLKTGAEGVYCAALPDLGLGLAVKVNDGAGRAAEVLLGQILDHLGVLTAADKEILATALKPSVLNRAGLEVGAVRPATGFCF